MELKLQATVTLDATPALIGALDRVADAIKGDGKAPAKPRAKAAKTNEPEPLPDAGEKAAQDASPAVPAATPEPAKPRQAVNPIVPPAATEAAPSAAAPPAPAAPTATPASATPAAKGIGPEEARRILIAIVQKHACPDALQQKLNELGYRTQFDMPDDVRADFVAWARQTYPISDAEVL